MAALSTPPTPSHSTTLLHSVNDFLIRVKNTLGKKSGSSKRRLIKPKQFLSMISSKSIKFRRKMKEEDNKADQDPREDGLWRREILMGDRCQPLDFPGVIYYDGNGKRVSELPIRSPRASPLPGFLLKPAEVK